jgi:hypothetical protein
MKTARNGRSNAGNGAGNGARNARKIALSKAEVEAVLEACRRYRHTIPVYLASTQSELRLIKAVIRKLS